VAKYGKEECKSMKRIGFFGVPVILGFLLIAQPAFVSGKSVSESGQKTILIAQAGQAETKPAGEAAQQSDKEKREGFQKEADKMIRDLDKKITALGKKVKKQGSKVKAEAKEAWDDLKAKQVVAKKKLKELSSSGAETWDKVKSEANGALEETRKAYDKAVSHFK
jgi:Skp family chaperone for outer membrane proteins